MKELKDHRVFLEYGPIRMLMDISIQGRKQPELAFMVGLHVVDEFKKAREHMDILKGQNSIRAPIQSYPISVQKMLEAVKGVGDHTLTPLAAVAGAFSDVALEKAIELGAQRVIINNGGDIAFKDTKGYPLKVGIPINPSGSPLNLTIADKNTRGVCTSGMGGRSFTKGIATAAVALAKTAALADACATYLGNETNVEDPNIVRCPAEKIDSETDIPGHQITLKVGFLSKKAVYTALLNGVKATEDLYQRDVIGGAVLCVKEQIVVIPSNMNISGMR